MNKLVKPTDPSWSIRSKKFIERSKFSSVMQLIWNKTEKKKAIAWQK